MFAALIALATTALVALVASLTVAIVQRRRAPRSPTVLAKAAVRHPARGVSAALLVLALSAAGLVLAFSFAQSAAEAESVDHLTPWALVPPSPIAAPVQQPAGQLATLPLD